MAYDTIGLGAVDGEEAGEGVRAFVGPKIAEDTIDSDEVIFKVGLKLGKDSTLIFTCQEKTP